MVVMFSLPSAAQDSRGLEAAASLHKQTIKAYKKGKFQDAITFWKGAEGLDPQWKYVFNQVNALIELDQWETAWEVWSRSERLGVPEGKEQLAAETRDDLSRHLLKKQAYLQLKVTPAGAVVKRNGALWKSPREVWTREESSFVTVEHVGYVSQSFSWNHKVGEEHLREAHLRLEAGGKVVSALPHSSPDKTDVPEGKDDLQDLVGADKATEPVKKPDEGTKATGDPVDKDDGAGTKDVEGPISYTYKKPKPKEQTVFRGSYKPPEPKEEAFDAGPWILGGLGAASLASGAVLTYFYLDHDRKAQENPGVEGTKEREEIEETYNLLSLGQWIGYSVGGAMIVGAIVWASLDDGDSHEDSVSVDGYIGPGTAGATIHFRF